MDDSGIEIGWVFGAELIERSDVRGFWDSSGTQRRAEPNWDPDAGLIDSKKLVCALTVHCKELRKSEDTPRSRRGAGAERSQNRWSSVGIADASIPTQTGWIHVSWLAGWISLRVEEKWQRGKAEGWD